MTLCIVLSWMQTWYGHPPYILEGAVVVGRASFLSEWRLCVSDVVSEDHLAVSTPPGQVCYQWKALWLWKGTEAEPAGGGDFPCDKPGAAWRRGTQPCLKISWITWCKSSNQFNQTSLSIKLSLFCSLLLEHTVKYLFTLWYSMQIRQLVITLNIC